jgi:hypothetical protein
MTESERARLQSLAETIRVYPGHSAYMRQGCWWYPDREVALAWAVGIPRNGLLSTGTIAKQHVRAVFDRTGEVEFIIDCKEVAGVTTTSHNTTAS